MVTATALLLLAGLYVSARLGGGTWLGTLRGWLRRHAAAQKALLVVGSVLITVGGVELAGRLLATAGLVEVFSPMVTQLPAGTEDWRLAHITADRYREPDPVLWWRPVAGGPYNAQHMKGPVAAIPKPPGTFRIICYGDSNTDGPDRGGWPERLGELLAARQGRPRFEVLDAGVAGYSSHQGLLRFRRQAARYRPDLVLVSFGWNDLATALGAPDASFEPPSALHAGVERLLLRYTSYRIAKHYLAPHPVVSATAVLGHRVPLADYLANLRSFAREAAAHGAKIALLTRPHRLPEAALRRLTDNWRGEVPDYDDALRRLGRRTGTPVIDVERYFEERHPDAFGDECHFTLAGHAEMAAFLERELARRGLLPRAVPPADDSATHLTGTSPSPGQEQRRQRPMRSG